VAKAHFNSNLHKPSAKADGNKTMITLNLLDSIAVHFSEQLAPKKSGD
jgi:hypothetical protein